MREDLRRKIIARRAAFIAAAVASTTANCGPCNPMVCLEPPAIDAPLARADTGVDADAEPDAK